MCACKNELITFEIAGGLNCLLINYNSFILSSSVPGAFLSCKFYMIVGTVPVVIGKR